MAEKNCKVDEAIEIVYQAPNAVSGLDIRVDIYNESKVLSSPDNPMAEVGDTGTYRRSFTPNAIGEWQAVMYVFVDSATRNGQVTKRYSVGAHNVDSVGTNMAKEATVAKDNTVAKAGADGDTLKDISDQIDGVADSVGSLDTPPMVS